MNQGEIGEPLALTMVDLFGGREKSAGVISRAATMMEGYLGQNNRGWIIGKRRGRIWVGFGFWISESGE